MPKTIEQIQKEWDETEKRGLALMGDYPELIRNAVTKAEGRARRYRKTVGDISGDAVSAAIADLVKSAVMHGIPTEDDERAVWFSSTVNRAVDREYDRARARWTARRRTLTGETSEAPNVIENWAPEKLIRHAELYTNGKLSTVVQARAIIDGRAESPTVAPRRKMVVTRQAGSTFVYGTQRTAYPSAESAFHRGFLDAMTKGFIDGSPELLASFDSYRDERRRVKRGDPLVPIGTITRPRYVSWREAMRLSGTGGDIRRRVQSAVKRFNALAPSLASIPRGHVGRPIPLAATVPTWLYRWAIRVPTAIFSPTVETPIRGTVSVSDSVFRLIRTVPTYGAPFYALRAFSPNMAPPVAPMAPYVSKYVARGDHSALGTWREEDDAPRIFWFDAARRAIEFERSTGRGTEPIRTVPSLTVCADCSGASADMSIYRHPTTCTVHRAESDSAISAHRAMLAESWATMVFRNAGPVRWATYPARWGQYVIGTGAPSA